MNKNKILSVLKYVISFVFAIGLFAYIYRHEDVWGMLKNLTQANGFWVSLSVVIALLSHFSRAWRWGIMLQPLGYQPSKISTFTAVMVGYLANLVVPRMGEISRCGVLHRMEKIPANVSFGAVIAERVIDLLCLILITITAFFLEFDRIGTFVTSLFDKPQNSPVDNTKWYVLGGLLAFGLLVLGVLFLMRKKIMELPIYDKIIAFLLGLKDGLLSIAKLNRQQKSAFFFHTVAIWLCYYLTSYVLFFALDTSSDLGMRCALSLLAMGGISIVVPVQGGIGVYHFLAATTLVAYGMTETDAKFLTFLIHNLQLIMFVVVGLIALLVSFYRKKV